MDAEATGTALDRGTVLALVAMRLGVFLIANDVTALSVAVPITCTSSGIIGRMADGRP